MANKNIRVGILGGGIAGLVAAYELSKTGIKVVILEKSERLGGLAGSFSIDNENEIEKYYHFICKPDNHYLDMMSELGIKSRLRWNSTKMGLVYNNELSTFGDPFSLIIFPYLSLIDKIKFAWTTFKTKSSKSMGWKNISTVSASEWLIAEYGQRTYELLYEPLINLKFRKYASNISAAWMWARFHRLGNSRTILQKEYIGYLEGGSQEYINALEDEIRRMGGEIRLNSLVNEIVVEGNTIEGVVSQNELLQFDYVISTVPLPNIRSSFVDLKYAYFDNIRTLDYIGVMVMVLRLKKQFSKYFWMNINDPDMDIAGIIEYTNLNPCNHLGKDAILYIPQYLPSDHHQYLESNDKLFRRYCEYLSMIRPDFNQSWVKNFWVFRNRFAQPICDMNFEQKIPDIETPIQNFYLTDSYQIQPDDRTISNSTCLGKKAASYIVNQIMT